jgi:hypothetical protein
MFLCEDLYGNLDIIKYYFNVFKDDYEIENEISNLDKYSSKLPLKNKVLKIFNITERAYKILQIGFDPYKIILFLHSSFHSKITILHDFESDYGKDVKLKGCLDFLTVRFSDRIQFVNMKIRESLNNIVTYSFEKYNIIDINIFEEIYFRLAYYISNNNTLIICNQGLGINTVLNDLLKINYNFENMYIFNFIFIK